MSASAPIDNPSRPMCVARPRAASTMAALVCGPFAWPGPWWHGCGGRVERKNQIWRACVQIKRTFVLFCSIFDLRRKPPQKKEVTPKACCSAATCVTPAGERGRAQGRMSTEWPVYAAHPPGAAGKTPARSHPPRSRPTKKPHTGGCGAWKERQTGRCALSNASLSMQHQRQAGVEVLGRVAAKARARKTLQAP